MCCCAWFKTRVKVKRRTNEKRKAESDEEPKTGRKTHDSVKD